MLLVKVQMYFSQLNFSSSFTHLQLNFFTCKLLSHCLLFKVHLPSTSPSNWLCFGAASLEAAFIYYHAAFFLSTTFFHFLSPPKFKFLIFVFMPMIETLFLRLRWPQITQQLITCISLPPCIEISALASIRCGGRLFRLPRDSFYTIPPHLPFHNLRLLAFTCVHLIYS